MESLFLTNITSPPLLFFLLGAAAVLLRSDLDIPEQIAKFLSIYLLFAIGFKGGAALADSDLSASIAIVLGVAVLLAALIPFLVFVVLRSQMSLADAAATAATYGSISAVTFVTATNYLDGAGIEWSGYLVAAMALMESPAIIVGLMLFRRFGDAGPGNGFYAKDILRESFLNGSVFLIVGSLIIGWISGATGKAQIEIFVDDLFVGVLCLFLLDMGIVAMRRIQDMRDSINPWKLTAFGIVFPLVNGSLGLAAGMALGLEEGDLLLLTVLTASASYIAVPAALRLSLPEANPSVYLAMSLAVTFPFNLLLGIPLYHLLIRLWT